MSKTTLTAEMIREYGKVVTCEEKDGNFHILITAGFDHRWKNVMKISQLIDKAVGSEYPNIYKMETDKNLFSCILKKANGVG